MKKSKTKFICGISASVICAGMLSVGMLTSVSADTLAKDEKAQTNVEETTEATTSEVTSITYDGHIVNSRYNILNFIKENMPEVPELRFDGNSVAKIGGKAPKKSFWRLWE